MIIAKARLIDSLDKEKELLELKKITDARLASVDANLALHDARA